MTIRKDVTLLTQNNVKTVKGEKQGVKTLILYLSPHKQNSMGKNLCPKASEGCSKACLFTSGFGGIYDAVKQGRINKTHWFLTDRKSFIEKLISEIHSAIKRYSDKWIINIRLNGTSDIVWENIRYEGKTIFEHFSHIQFYDYTKISNRFDKVLPKNYHLTFSRSETNEKEAIQILAKGYNVAAVFKGTLPNSYLGYKVINGDESDVRSKDEKNVIVGLVHKYSTGKGGKELNKFALSSGFVIV